MGKMRREEREGKGRWKKQGKRQEKLVKGQLGKEGRGNRNEARET
jgi:hypothetical protein